MMVLYAKRPSSLEGDINSAAMLTKGGHFFAFILLHVDNALACMLDVLSFSANNAFHSV